MDIGTQVVADVAAAAKVNDFDFASEKGCEFGGSEKLKNAMNKQKLMNIHLLTTTIN